jgi:hypothetical protein
MRIGAMANIPASEVKAKCLELMDGVAERRESFSLLRTIW